MSIFLLVVLPIGWALLGKVLGLALSAALFFNAAGNRLGRRVSRWCVPVLPGVFLVMIVWGTSGDAGHGFTLFGSATLFGLACAIPFYGVISLTIFAGTLYVIRDLTLGHLARPPE